MRPSSPTVTSASASSTDVRTSRTRLAEHLTIAATMYREMDMTFWLEKADAESRTLGTAWSGERSSEPSRVASSPRRSPPRRSGGDSLPCRPS